LPLSALVEGLEGACDAADGMVQEPGASTAATVAVAALFILVPAIPAVIGTMHMMGSARGGSRGAAGN
jgi:hypothetical protein